jgi:hypothetical protein
MPKHLGGPVANTTERNASQDASLQPTGDLAFPRARSNLADTVAVEVKSFEFLRGKSAEEFLALCKDDQNLVSDQRQALKDLRQIMSLTQKTMLRMNNSYPGLPPDSISKTLDLVTRPGASVVLLKGKDPSDRTSDFAVHGYGVVIRGRENFPDGDLIPDRLFHGESHRLIRLFVDDVARLQLPPGEAFSHIIDRIKEISSGGPIIGMVLTDLLAQGDLTYPSQGKLIWLEAKKALEARGFEDSQEVIAETIEVPGRPAVFIPFRWYVWPPLSDEGARCAAAQKARFQMQAEQQRERLAGIFSSLPPHGGVIEYSGSAQDAFDIASQSPGNFVIARRYQSSERGANREGIRPNLVMAPAEQGFELERSSADAVVINGVLPDVIGNSPSETARSSRLRQFMTDRKAALKDGGFLVVRDTVSLRHEGLVKLAFSAHSDSRRWGGKALGEVFKEFVADKREATIAREIWSQVRLLHKDAGRREIWVAPREIVAEFLAKFPYYADWARERERPYTAQSVQERIASLTEGGMRLMYAGPENSAYVRASWRDGLVDVGDLGRSLHDDFPTNHLSIAEKVAPGEGIGFEVGEEATPGRNPFVRVRCFNQIDQQSGEVIGYREVASRKHRTLDVVPYDIHGGALWVRGRIYPRPLTALHQGLDGAQHGGYKTEQVGTIVQPDDLKNPESLRRTVQQILTSRVGISDSEFDVDQSFAYFPAPNSVDEKVTSVPVRVSNLPIEDDYITDSKVHYGGRYRVRSFNAVQFLQAQQIGIEPDPRLERVIYSLLQRHKLSRGPWLGAILKPTVQEQDGLRQVSFTQVCQSLGRSVFREVADVQPIFLGTHKRIFTERLAGTDKQGTSKAWEYVEPAPQMGVTHESISVLPIAKVRKPDGSEEVLVGLEVRELPGPQLVDGTSSLITVPTVRIPSTCSTLDQAERDAVEKLKDLFGITVRAHQRLGGKYFISPGITPEVVFPMIAEVDLKQSRSDALHWVPLRSIMHHMHELKCGHAITSLWRASHMLNFQSSARYFS